MALALALAGFAPLTRAQPPPDESDQAMTAPPAGSAGEDAAPTGEALEGLLLGAPLVYQADTIAVFRATLAGITPTRRAEGALERLEALPRARMLQPVRVEPFEQAFAVLLGDAPMFLIANGDAPSGQTAAQVAEAAGQRLGSALAARAKLLSPGERLRSVLAMIAGTIVLVVLIRLLVWAHRKTLVLITSQSEAHRGKLKLGDVDFVAQFSVVLTWAARIATQISGLVVVVLWVVFVLNRFPETQRWGAAARSSIFGILRAFELGLLRAIPGIIGVALIALVARFATRLATDIFNGIERGTIRLPGMHPDTADATRRLVTALIWLFSIVVAYPLLPGSDSDAFKGVSVFLGLILTLGSTGVVSHLMSGLVLIYSRALKPGDFVRVQEIEGVVIDVGSLSVKIANAKNEEFTIPNAVIVGTIVKNYSRLAGDAGAALTTSVTIGYDAPWRVVHELLLTAADRTPGVRKEPAPMVIQTSLSDFYVEYQLVVRLEQADRRVAILNVLHQNIQDAFNERGVQIMSPAFESQPEQPVIVPKSKWFAAPGDRPQAG
jgi:small-conductance mechanosensitive channel